MFPIRKFKWKNNEDDLTVSQQSSRKPQIDDHLSKVWTRACHWQSMHVMNWYKVVVVKWMVNISGQQFESDNVFNHESMEKCPNKKRRNRYKINCSRLCIKWPLSWIDYYVYRVQCLSSIWWIQKTNIQDMSSRSTMVWGHLLSKAELPFRHIEQWII